MVHEDLQNVCDELTKHLKRLSRGGGDKYIYKTKTAYRIMAKTLSSHINGVALKTVEEEYYGIHYDDGEINCGIVSNYFHGTINLSVPTVPTINCPCKDKNLFMRTSSYDRALAIPCHMIEYHSFLIIDFDALSGYQLCHLGLLSAGPMSYQQRVEGICTGGKSYKFFAKVKRGNTINNQFN